MPSAEPMPDGARPVLFDRPGRRLFGWYHPPAIGADGTWRDCAVVLVSPIGYDAVYTHRHYRNLAQQLAAAGFAVLRYDHHGTGDSSGGETAPERIAAWMRGVQRAAEFARSSSGAARVGLFGVRLGGTLALAAAAGASDGLIDGVAAWAPYPSGQNFLREMRALAMRQDADPVAAPPAHDPGADAGEEAAGHLLTASTIAALGTLDLLALDRAPAAQVLLLDRDDLPGRPRLARHLESLGCDLRLSTAPGYAAMMREPYDATLPAEAFAAVRRWLEDGCPPGPAPAVVPLPPVFPAHLHGPADGVEELPMRFGRDGNLFGLLARPVVPAPGRAQVGIVFATVGANLHTGPHRMHVQQSRLLAERGFVALRIDIGGIGESPAAPGRAHHQLHADHSVGDVLDAVALLRERCGVQRVVVIGLCSGGYLAFHAALDAASGIDSIVLINQQTFQWREGDSYEVRRRANIRSVGFYRSRLFDGATWRRLLRGKVDVARIAVGMTHLVRRRAALKLAAWQRRGDGTHAADGVLGDRAPALNVQRAMTGLLQRGLQVYFIFSADDGGLDEIETHLGPGGRRMRKHTNFRLEIVPGADHTFTPRWAQRHLAGLVEQHVTRLYG